MRADRGLHGFVTLLTYLPSYLTAVNGRDTGTAGLLMLLLTAPVLVCPMLAARLVGRGVRPLTLVFLSLACLVLGDLALTVLSSSVGAPVLAGPMLVTGAGMGLSAGLVDGQALALVDPAKAGMAAGFLNTLRLGSEAVAVAVYGSALATALGRRVGDGIDGYPGAADAARSPTRRPGATSSAPPGSRTRPTVRASPSSSPAPTTPPSAPCSGAWRPSAWCWPR
ncbi:MFS transporter [Kitasatospora aureofaciens]|uniref:Uncharacterized protein n=1 Tax=Kitasatospora aureofaciens TaxID=1894 RepID=A0A1E7N0Q8_KITAU|nr:MFS transporter [Kitasatospora aureofaciens]OEV34053.1 hypothetical protein HS99_0011475 [Kitasatospora aureofaciens]GGU72808.1 hypothetical protein GCM10010502_25520 [Kitasatospora aureofaciens]